jgi:DNA-binding transcriptional MocR family regulator
VAHQIEGLIEAGTLRPGDRIPSVRRLSRQLSVSVTTVLEAYRLLEDRRLVRARPQSGYYVRLPPEGPPEPGKTPGEKAVVEPDLGDLVLRILREAANEDLVPLGAAIPSPEFFPLARLNRILARVVRDEPWTIHSYDAAIGDERLRQQIVRRALEAGCSLRPEEIIITAGAQEAVHLALRAVTKPGDTVAIESPTYYGLLEALESLHLKALEVSTDPRDGICLRDLEEALDRHTIAACVLVPTFGNPLGHCMTPDNKRRLVEMLAERDVPLIEDDVYGELGDDDQRPPAAKAFDGDGMVLLCSSFSKTLAPGYRIGWCAPGRYTWAVERLKFSTSVANPVPTQRAVAAFLESGGFERYLRRLRRTYHDLRERMTCAVADHFPSGTKVTRPAGGHVLWVEFPEGVDALRLHEEALQAGVSIAPGPLFSTCDCYDSCIRLNCAVPWSVEVETAMLRLGALASRHLDEPGVTA